MKQILVLVCFLGFQLSSLCQDIAGVWSGTITQEINGTSELGIYHEKAVLRVQNNRVTGSVTRLDTFIIEGKIMGTDICTSSGSGELWRIAFSKDKLTYDIEVMAPEGQCTSTSYIGLPSETTAFIPAGIQALERPMGANRNLLVGSHTETVSSPGGNISQTVTTSWHLARTAGVELIVDPNDYENWLPQPGKDELTAGALMTIRLKLLNPNGTVPTIKAKKFILELINTSHEPGITINIPQQPLFPQLQDLRFLAQSNAILNVGFQSLEINCNSCVTGTAQLASYDGGGWTTLKVKAILDDNTEVEGKLLSSNGPTEILIPKREPDSHIGLKWLDANGNPGEDDDKEESNGNTKKGDGLTAYEEYRGVMATGTTGKQEFKRLDPKKKELGVWMKKTEAGLFDKGIQLFENTTDLRVIKFYEQDIAADRKLNRNFSTAHQYDQYVLRLEKGPLPEGVSGLSTPVTDDHQGQAGPPSFYKKIVVDIDKVRRFFQYYRSRSITVLSSEQEYIAGTTAHELGHGVSINHHGPATRLHDLSVIRTPNRVTILEPDGNVLLMLPPGDFEIRDQNNQPITATRYLLRGPVGDMHNAASGDLDCLIAYTHAYNWCIHRSGGKYVCLPVPDMRVGKTLCTSGAGTGINSNHEYFDDVLLQDRGKCISRINLK